jgi:hypothetical protein
MRAFEQTAEIFFAGDVPGAFLVAEVGHGLVFHFEPLKAHDADVFLVLFPDLALAELHGTEYMNRKSFWKKSVPPGFRVGRDSDRQTTFSFSQPVFSWARVFWLLIWWP